MNIFPFISFSAIRCKSLMWRLTFNISWCKPFVEYFVYEPTKQELWNFSNVHRSEIIKLKKPAVGNLVRRNLVSRHLVSRHWTRVKQQRNYVSRYLNLVSRHWNLVGRHWNLVSLHWNFSAVIEISWASIRISGAGIEISCRYFESLEPALESPHTQWADDEISVAICSYWPALESLQLASVEITIQWANDEISVAIFINLTVLESLHW